MGDQLQVQLEGAVASHMIQLDATKNAERLASVLENLTSTTQVELQQINNATHTIRESLLVTQGREYRIWYSILLGGFRMIGGGMIPQERPLMSGLLAYRGLTRLPPSIRTPRFPRPRDGRTPGLEYHLVLTLCDDGDYPIRI